MLKRLINNNIFYIKDIVEDRAINNYILSLIKLDIAY